jgi:ribonuclease P protein component
MLAKKYRLPIQSVLNKSGRTFRSRSFLIKLFLNKLDFNRFGVVISKKVSKLAVKRNLIKRIVLDSAKKFVRQPADPENKNKADVLIIISPAMIKMEKADIIKELEEAFRKIIKS